MAAKGAELATDDGNGNVRARGINVDMNQTVD